MWLTWETRAKLRALTWRPSAGMGRATRSGGGPSPCAQVAAPRDPFPPAGSTSSGLAASEYTQTSPTPARGTQYALSVSWCSLDHRLRRPRKGSSLHTWAQAQDLLVD